MNPSLKPFFRQLNWLYLMILAGMITFFVVAFMMAGGVNEHPDPAYRWLNYGAPASGIALMILSHRFYLNRIRDAKEEEKLHVKLQGYRNGTIVRLVILDGAALVNLISFGLTGSWLFMALAGIITLLFIAYKPSLNKMVKDLQIEGAEKDVIFNSERIESKE